MESGDFSKVALVLEAVELHLDAADLRSRLNKCVTKDIPAWKDENSLDLIHHCILQNNIVALVLLLSKGYFKPPYEPKTWPYLHLVACLGQRSCIPTLIQEHKFQNDACLLDWKLYKKVIFPKVQGASPELDDKEKAKKHRPVDVAALFQHAGCVRLLLDFWQVQMTNCGRRTVHSTKSVYLYLACKMNSPNVLRLLLREKESDEKEALECAVRMSAPECVDVILREGGSDTARKAFQNMNLFHVLYSYSSCLELHQYKAMVEITTILLRHHQDVNTLRPSRTFPLYSLLSHTIAGNTMDACTPFLISTLLILLTAGADPNVDEILIEDKLGDLEQNTAFGRRPYSSAINCILCNLPILKGKEALSDESDSVDKYVYSCIELLIRHGADLSNLGKFNSNPYDEFAVPSNSIHYGSSLHLLMSLRASCHIYYPILRFLCRYGVDADAKGFWSSPFLEKITVRYAVNILPFSVFLASLISSQTQSVALTDHDLKQIFYIMKFMSQTALVAAYKEFVQVLYEMKERLSRDDRPRQTQADVFERNEPLQKIVDEYESLTKEPWTLQKCCAHSIWKACRMHMGNIFDLPIPKPLQNIVLAFH